MKKFKFTLLAFMAAMMQSHLRLVLMMILLQIRGSMKVIITSTFL